MPASADDGPTPRRNPGSKRQSSGVRAPSAGPGQPHFRGLLEPLRKSPARKPHTVSPAWARRRIDRQRRLPGVTSGQPVLLPVWSRPGRHVRHSGHISIRPDDPDRQNAKAPRPLRLATLGRSAHLTEFSGKRVHLSAPATQASLGRRLAATGRTAVRAALCADTHCLPGRQNRTGMAMTPRRHCSAHRRCTPASVRIAGRRRRLAARRSVRSARPSGRHTNGGCVTNIRPYCSLAVVTERSRRCPQCH